MPIGGGGGIIITGDKPIADEVKIHIDRVMPSCRERFLDIYAKYEANGSGSDDDGCFILECAMQIIRNWNTPHPFDGS